MNVTIFRSKNSWVLCIAYNTTVLKIFQRPKLKQTIDLACQLRLHVDNVNELPLTQYLNQGA